MKKLIALIFLAIPYFTSTNQGIDIEMRKKIDITKSIEKDLDLKLNKFGRKWTRSEKEKTVNALLLAEVFYSINHTAILALAQNESEFRLYAINKKNKNGTIDKGWLQINSCNMDIYSHAYKILKDHDFDVSLNNHFDPAIATMAAAIYLSYNRSQLISSGRYSSKRLVVSYNCGLTGSDEKNSRFYRLQDIRKEYYIKYSIARKDFSLSKFGNVPTIDEFGCININ